MESTARWMMRAVLRQDWVERHNTLRQLAVTHPSVYRAMCAMLAPDQALCGACTGIQRWPADLPIPLQNRDKQDTMSQRRITDYFEPKRRRAE